ncbi:MAG: GTP 3',8-cyclase MoaA [Archaeoglobaceae archaeon]
MLTDRFGRKVTNLRIAITSRCNLRCFYCHREGETSPQGSTQDLSKKEMSVEDIKRICDVFYDLGIKKVKITGGEPLLRKDIFEIIQSMPPFKEISMTTNGMLLAQNAYELAEVGLSRVNISLDTMDEGKYRQVTGGDLSKVVDAVYAAEDANLNPVKINMLILKGINEKEVGEMLDFTSQFNKDSINVILQIIENLMLPGMEEYYYDISPIEKMYSEMAEAVMVRKMHKRRQYAIDRSVVEFVKPLYNSEFCQHCNRIRVTSDGKIKPCLLKNDNLIDIKDLKGDDLVGAVNKAVSLREPFFCDS